MSLNFWQEKSSKFAILTQKSMKWIWIWIFNMKNQENIFKFAILTGEIKKINLKLWFNTEFCVFDKKNPVNWFNICHFEKSRKLIWIGDLTRKIKKIYLNFLWYIYLVQLIEHPILRILNILFVYVLSIFPDKSFRLQAFLDLRF